MGVNDVKATTPWRILVPALAVLAGPAYALIQSGMAQRIFRGSLEPGSEAFWLSILLAGAGLLMLMDKGTHTRASQVDASEPLKLSPSGRRGSSASGVAGQAESNRTKAA